MKLHSWSVRLILLLFSVIQFGTVKKLKMTSLQNQVYVPLILHCPHKKCSHVEWTNFLHLLFSVYKKKTSTEHSKYTFAFRSLHFFTPCPHFFYSEVLSLTMLIAHICSANAVILFASSCINIYYKYASKLTGEKDLLRPCEHIQQSLCTQRRHL